jgi:polysaccharide chain length determinant protein (PEP-CTERM system associated)
MNSKAMNLRDLLAEVSDHLLGMWRYRWVAIGIAWLISIGAWSYIYSMPSVYQGSAQLLVDTSSLMDPVFKDLTLRDNLATQLRAVSQALLTRPNIEAIGKRTGLDAYATTPKQRERLISQLQQRIQVEPRRRENTFDVSFKDTDRDMAQAVVAAVVDTFLENSRDNKGNDAEITARALEIEISDHEERLKSAEDTLTAFKQENIGYMPNDRGDYYARLQSSLSHVTEVEEQLRLAIERRDELKRQIEGEVPLAGGLPQGIVGCSREEQVTQLESELARLIVNFTDKHPRLVSLRENIATLREECGRELAAAAGAGIRPGDPLASNPVYQSLRMQLSATEVEIAGLRAQLSVKQEEVAQLRRDVSKIAEVEAELKQLNRDYTVVQARYQEYLKRRETLRSMQRLEPVADPVNLKVIEPPFASDKPVAPNRPLLALGALAFAIVVGLAVAFYLNQLKPVFFTPRSVRRAVGLSVLGTVSLLSTPVEARKRRVSSMAWAGSFLLLLLTAAVVVMFETQLLERASA